jgi:NADH-quinone oxidoreductase subunit N
MLFIVFSFVGLPPLFMFFGKFFLIMNLVNNFEYLLGFILLCFSVLSGFYYVRLMRFVFFNYDIENFFLVINNDKKIFIFIFFLSIFGFFFLDLFLLNVTNIILNLYG